MTQLLLNIFIYDHSRAHRLRLEKMIRNYAESSSIELGSIVSTTRPDKILNLSSARSALYFLNIDDLEKTMDGIEFTVNIRDSDLDCAIVFLAKQDIFAANCSDLALRSLRSHLAAMSFLAKDSVEYENEIKECIAAHMRKISTPIDRLYTGSPILRCGKP